MLCNAWRSLQLTCGRCVVPSRSPFQKGLVPAAAGQTVSTQPPAVSPCKIIPAVESPLAQTHTPSWGGWHPMADRCRVQRPGDLRLTRMMLESHSSCRTPCRRGQGCQLASIAAHCLPLPSCASFFFSTSFNTKGTL